MRTVLPGLFILDVLLPFVASWQSVNVDEDDIFDYIHTFADGRTEGNTTGEILIRQ